MGMIPILIISPPSVSANISSVLFFQACVLFSIESLLENALFWPIFANFGYFAANLRTFQCTFTGSNNPLVYQKGLILGMPESW